MLNDPYLSFADEVTMSDPLAAQLMRQLMDQGMAIDDHARRLLAPAAACLFEWQEYKLELPGADRLRVGTRSVSPFSTEHGLFRLIFENSLGLVELQPFQGTFPLCEPVSVEVISKKFPSVTDHVNFLTGLTTDLFARCTHLPFHLNGDTSRGVSESPQSATPFFVYHFLLQHGFSLADAVHAVIAHPHRELRTVEDIVPFHQVQAVDANVLVDIVHNPQRWVRSEVGAISRALNGFVPGYLRQVLPEETVDTPENRFVKTFVFQLAHLAERLAAQEWWSLVPSTSAEKIRVVTDELRKATLAPHFLEIGDMRTFPFSSRVLMQRSGYRELRQLYQVFQQARHPLFGNLDHAIELRTIDVLYEQWVFFALIEEITLALGIEPRLNLESSIQKGLHWTARAEFEDAGSLEYNKTLFGYSLSLRPDYLWVQDGKPTVALDAKFRVRRWELLNEDDDGLMTAIIKGYIQPTDVYKMHTYRDALSVRSAVALFPGTEARFYPVSGVGGRRPSLAELLTDDSVQGIGALPFLPTYY